jgi:hypothetical protein
VELGELTIRLYDRGREHECARRRFEARLVGLPAVRATGWSAFDALCRLVTNHRSVFDGRWPAPAVDDDDER